MINVICVKWGTKYNAGHVNQLYRMVNKNLTLPFKFYCLTEDPTDIDPIVNIIPIKHDWLEVWWNKLAMFEEGFGNLKGRCMFFDLDVVIQNNIDEIALYKHEGLCKIHAYWKPDSMISKEDSYNMVRNSSCLTWEADTLGIIWDYFLEHEDEILLKYRGIDRYMYWEEEINKLVTTFPKEWFYSRLFGDGVTPVTSHDFKNNMYLCPERKVCLLNGMGKGKGMTGLTEEEVMADLQIYLQS